ncbi:META domain-containing protein [Hymenobacter rigui]|uniref:META domain-containing protein n=1 Tax=Hymenobacter rigui TaxID=334424 RepID=A0A3R9P3X7_9BACT|nr:META domain-containing protein [Hymenobacter rigui]RSK49610.1 META domain-containing protein [Hymenobacter rigui]
MHSPVYSRSLLVLGLFAATACNYDLNERPAASSTPGTVGRLASVASLRNVRWELRQLAGQPAPATEQTPFLILHDNRARVEGRAGCNKFSGPYTMAGPGQLRLGPLVTTRSACASLTAEGAFLKALNQAQSYQVRGSMLSLYGIDTLGTPLAQLEAVPDE